jgi:Asp-tRNA(Asn)/Glu-tRNA(Gln) amidotransferase A subunit family amidase
MARSVADAALLLQVISGPDPRALKVIREPAPDGISRLEDGVKNVRIGWTPDFGHLKADPRAVAAAEAAVRALADAGAEVVPLGETIPHPWGDGSSMRPLQEVMARGGYPMDPVGEVPDASEAEQWLIECSVRGVTCWEIPEFRLFLDEHRSLLTPPLRITQENRSKPGQMPTQDELRAVFDRVLTKHEVLCTPTMATIAPLAPDGWAAPYDNSYMGSDFTFVANSMGTPAITVPCGLVDGLPVGLQIIGPRGGEAIVLRVARAAEAAMALALRPPAIST